MSDELLLTGMGVTGIDGITTDYQHLIGIRLTLYMRPNNESDTDSKRYDVLLEQEDVAVLLANLIASSQIVFGRDAMTDAMIAVVGDAERGFGWSP